MATTMNMMPRAALRRCSSLRCAHAIISSSANALPRRALFSSSTTSASDLQVQQRGRLRDEHILAHIVCPISKFPLRYDIEQGALICDEIHVAYPIRYGLPMLVPTEARIISQDGSNDED